MQIQEIARTFAIFALLGACGLSKESEQSAVRAGEETAKLNFALHELKDNRAFLVVANPSLSISKVSICVGRKAQCELPAANTMLTTIKFRQSQSALVLFRSKDAVELKTEARYTAIATTASGETITSEIKLVNAQPNTASLSGGTGGKVGFNEYSFAASNGKRSVYKYTAAADVHSKAEGYGLLLYLHGDMGADYSWFYNTLASVALKNNLLPVAVKSPTVGSFAQGAGPSWWQDGDNNAVFLDELLKKDIIGRFNIDTNRVYYTGASGGPTFLSGPWLKRYAHQYRGGAILFCGGLSSTQFPYTTSPGFEEGVKLTYYVGDQDFLLSGAQQAIRYYQAKGFDVYSEFPQGVGHCGFSNQMGSLLNRFVRGYLNASVTKEPTFNLVEDSGIINPDPQYSFPQVRPLAR